MKQIHLRYPDIQNRFVSPDAQIGSCPPMPRRTIADQLMVRHLARRR